MNTKYNYNLINRLLNWGVMRMYINNLYKQKMNEPKGHAIKLNVVRT